MSEKQRTASLRVQSVPSGTGVGGGQRGHHRNRTPASATTFALPLSLNESKVGGEKIGSGEANDRNYVAASDQTAIQQRSGREDRPKSSRQVNMEPVNISLEEIKEIRSIPNLHDRIEELKKKYDGKFPEESQGERFTVFKRQYAEITGPKDNRSTANDEEFDGQDGHLVGSGRYPEISGTGLMLGAATASARNYDRHFFRRRKKKETKAERRRRLDEEAKAKLAEKEKLRLAKEGKLGSSAEAGIQKTAPQMPGANVAEPVAAVKTGEEAVTQGAAALKDGETAAKGLRAGVAEGETALKGGESAVKGVEAAAKGSKSFMGGVKAFLQGSKVMRLGTFLAAGAVGAIVGTAALVGGVAVLGGATVGLLAYRYGRASGEKSIGRALKAGSELLIPQEARKEFAEARKSFSQGKIWDGIKKGFAGCDEVLGLTAGLKWFKDQAVDFAMNPADKMRRITKAVDTGAEAAKIVWNNPVLQDALLATAGAAAAGNETTHSMHELESAVKKDAKAAALVKQNPALLGFAAVPKSAVPAPSGGQAVTQTRERGEDDAPMVASTGWVPEPDAG